MELLNMDLVIEELKKTTLRTNKAIVEEIGKLKKDYDQQMDFLRKTNEMLNADNVKLQDSFNEQLRTNSNLQKQLDKIKEELEKTNKKIILSKDNQSRAGRPTLEDGQIEVIKKYLKEGFPMRKVAELAEVSLGSVSNYSKDTKRETSKNTVNEQFLSLDECIEKKRFCNSEMIGVYAFHELEKAYCTTHNIKNDGNLFARTSEENHKLAIKEVNKRIMESGKKSNECIENMIKDIESGKLWNSSKK